ncbi:metalloregulator ArsR/SmtB family transcription factor [Anaerocolumna sp. AGMB13025]|uniref:ArsR/SmtB family transcription factor n=1 Tax=Anaerocolumna sp. AGMB13025 TaxID=3039116 RepID=UPI00241D15AB|nr:metalloregulator ArsR/SmtB family transcription factor [Anaerocolumna sp. AGMB13025]WFR57052.1 metalloregulator ArsR/SmtB family transcription factor [Anaerocolumna sp. AGMB13025]
MQAVIKKEINYVEEAHVLLFNYVNGITYDKMMTESYKNFAYSKEIFDKKYERILGIHHYVINNMRFDKNKLDFYFKEIGSSKMSLSNYLLPIYTGTQYGCLKEYEEAARRKSSEEVIKDFDYILSQYISIGKSGDESKVETFEDLMRIMDKTDLSAEEKWKIIQAFIDRSAYLEEVLLILDKTIQLLKECQKEINELEQEFYDYWLDYTKDTDIIKLLQDYTNIVWEYNAEGTYILPSIFCPQSISFSINDEEEKNPDLIRLGVILDSNLAFKHPEVDSEKLNTALKLLSDKSKFEILKLIKDKPAYGFEIANTLNLSTSTISYHMNSLIMANLIKIEKDANKIYYTTNKETVNRFLEDIRTLLL